MFNVCSFFGSFFLKATRLRLDSGFWSWTATATRNQDDPGFLTARKIKVLSSQRPCLSGNLPGLKVLSYTNCFSPTSDQDFLDYWSRVGESFFEWPAQEFIELEQGIRSVQHGAGGGTVEIGPGIRYRPAPFCPLSHVHACPSWRTVSWGCFGVLQSWWAVRFFCKILWVVFLIFLCFPV